MRSHVAMFEKDEVCLSHDGFALERRQRLAGCSLRGLVLRACEPKERSIFVTRRREKEECASVWQRFCFRTREICCAGQSRSCLRSDLSSGFPFAHERELRDSS